jgi:hypothetical protein
MDQLHTNAIEIKAKVIKVKRSDKSGIYFTAECSSGVPEWLKLQFKRRRYDRSEGLDIKY